MSLQLDEIKKSSAGIDFGRLEDGTYLARIVSVVDFGLQPQTDWKTKEPTDPKKRIMITFETPDEFITYEDKEGNEVSRPRWISKEYTLSMHEKSALFKLVTTIAPDANSLVELLNVPCMISVGSTDGGNAKITGVNKPMKGAAVGELQNETFHFDFDSPNMDLFNKLPAWQQTKIKEANNYNGFADVDDVPQVANGDF